MSEHDRRILWDLARHVADIAARPEQDEKRQRWYAHNSLDGRRPLFEEKRRKLAQRRQGAKDGERNGLMAQTEIGIFLPWRLRVLSEAGARKRKRTSRPT